jgi:hypothetical protein
LRNKQIVINVLRVGTVLKEVINLVISVKLDIIVGEVRNIQDKVEHHPKILFKTDTSLMRTLAVSLHAVF